MLDWNDYLSAELDGAGAGPPDAAVVICSAPRAGSHMLGRAMIAAGLGVPFEYLHPIFRKSLEERWRSYSAEEFGKVLAAKRTRNGVFAIKMEWPWMPALSEISPWVLPERVLWVYLVRQSIVDQTVSLYAAELTGEYGASGTQFPAMRSATKEGLEWCLNLIAGQEASWRMFFGRNGIEPMFLSYESLVDDVLGVIGAMAEVLGKPWDARAVAVVMESDRPAAKPRGLAEEIRALLPLKVKAALAEL